MDKTSQVVEKKHVDVCHSYVGSTFFWLLGMDGQCFCFGRSNASKTNEFICVGKGDNDLTLFK